MYGRNFVAPPRRADQAAHDTLVRRLAAQLRGQGHLVWADVPGYPTPGLIRWSGTGEGHRPDIQTGAHVIEVETADTLGSDHTRSQLQLFSAFARENKRACVAAVPLGSGAAMRVQLLIWQLTAAVAIWEV